MNTFIQSTDTALIKRFQEGNNDALETLIRRHEEKIFSSIFFLVLLEAPTLLRTFIFTKL